MYIEYDFPEPDEDFSFEDIPVGIFFIDNDGVVGLKQERNNLGATSREYQIIWFPENELPIVSTKNNALDYDIRYPVKLRKDLTIKICVE